MHLSLPLAAIHCKNSTVNLSSAKSNDLRLLHPGCSVLCVPFPCMSPAPTDRNALLAACEPREHCFSPEENPVTELDSGRPDAARLPAVDGALRNPELAGKLLSAQ